MERKAAQDHAHQAFFPHRHTLLIILVDPLNVMKRQNPEDICVEVLGALSNGWCHSDQSPKRSHCTPRVSKTFGFHEAQAKFFLGGGPQANLIFNAVSVPGTQMEGLPHGVGAEGHFPLICTALWFGILLFSFLLPLLPHSLGYKKEFSYT